MRRSLVSFVPLVLAACSGQLTPAASGPRVGKADAPGGMPVTVVGSVSLGTYERYANREAWNHSIDDEVIDAYTFQVPAYQQVSVGADFFDSGYDGPGGFVWVVDPNGKVLATNSPANADGTKRVPSWPFLLTLHDAGTYQVWVHPLHTFEFNIDLINRGICFPATCGGNKCGTMSDGCGGQLDCGGCSGGATCGGTGVPNQCGVHQPTTGLPAGPVALSGSTEFACGFTDAYEASYRGSCTIWCDLRGEAPGAVTATCSTSESVTLYRWSEPVAGPNYGVTMTSAFEGNLATFDTVTFDGTRLVVGVATDGKGQSSLGISEFSATGQEGGYRLPATPVSMLLSPAR